MVAIINTQSNGSAGSNAPVIDSSTSTSTSAALSANQGRIIRQDLDAVTSVVAGFKSSMTPHVVPVSDGQVTFGLPTIPTNPASVVMFVNGIAYAQATADFTINGSVVTWGNDPPLTKDDEVFFTYN